MITGTHHPSLALPALPRLPSFTIHPLGVLVQLLTGGLRAFVEGARRSIGAVLHTYLFGTFDASHPAAMIPFTAGSAVSSLNRLVTTTATALTVAVFLIACARSVTSHSLDASHTLQVVVPRLLVAVLLMHASLPLIQLAINLNNALALVFVGHGAVDPASLPWAAPMSGPALRTAGDNLFLLLFTAVMVVGLAILVLAYVVRYTLLAVLCVAAPLAALLHVLPETSGYARQWLRLFSVTLFMQAVQLLVLRVAVALAFDRHQSLVAVIYALATLYLMLKVPGALNVAAHWETSATGAGKRVGRAARRLVALETGGTAG